MSIDTSDSPPSAVIVRPPSVDYLVADYGQYIGLDGFAFDQENHIVLEVSGVAFVLEYAGEGIGFVFQSVISTSEKPFSDPGLYQTINLLNANSFRIGGGIVFAAPESQQIFWMDRLNTEGLTVEMLDEAIKSAASHALTWTSIIHSVFENEENGTGVELQNTVESNPMIRI